MKKRLIVTSSASSFIRDVHFVCDDKVFNIKRNNDPVISNTQRQTRGWAEFHIYMWSVAYCADRPKTKKNIETTKTRQVKHIML